MTNSEEGPSALPRLVHYMTTCNMKCTSNFLIRLPYSVSKSIQFSTTIHLSMHQSICSLYNTPHYNYNLRSKCIPQKVITHLTPTSSSESPYMTHTFTTGTPYSAVTGIGEEIPHLQSIASTYMVHWGEGPSCLHFAGSETVDIQCHI
jgi:hypothetical protein